MSDDEIRAIWQEAEKGGPYGGIVRLAVGQQRLGVRPEVVLAEIAATGETIELMEAE